MSAVGAASRRYVRRFVTAMAIYVVLLVGVIWLMQSAAAPGPPLRYGLAVLPALPILAVVWALGRLLVEETDEVLRARVIQQLLWGSALALSASTVWGFLEAFGGAPHLHAYWVFPVFCLGMLISLPFVWRKYS
ncbi:hypothetical protein LJR219_000071 [Phenylobacterium sp. LjRoot219]|uniref:hypothetical protein n=1 Tax=Phenylobacterium sp. LjRoot219 TaxID=3342283 RepID=UPI003ECD4BF2